MNDNIQQFDDMLKANSHLAFYGPSGKPTLAERIAAAVEAVGDKRIELGDFDKSEYVSEDQYNDMLDDCYGEVEVAGMLFSSRRILEELDNTAYRCGYNDYVDSIDLDMIPEYRELEEELEELEVELEELEELRDNRVQALADLATDDSDKAGIVDEIRRYFNVNEADTEDGDIHISGPCRPHWISDDKRDDFLEWACSYGYVDAD